MQNKLRSRKSIFIAALGIFVLATLLTLGFVVYSFSHVPELFKLNKECQEQGYYMGEFEFKALGIVRWIDNGQYIKATTVLNNLHKQLKNKEGLIKLPDFENKEQELDFYLSLQNPKTGAFMDNAYPFCEYTGPTGNILNHLDELAENTGQQLKLKYPLKYLDRINTPEKMKSYLDDISTVGWLGSKFPQTTFHNARDILSLYYEDNVVEKYGLYNMPPETKKALLEWFYQFQDAETGLWGPKDSNGKLIKKDTMNTASIIKAFVDNNGNDIHKDFPLRYRDKLAESFLNSIKPIPNDDKLDQWHEWNLDTSKSIRTLTRYLWKGLSEESKLKTKAMIEKHIRIMFQKFYISEEGAFGYYPGAKNATIDGTGFINNFKDYGYCSEEKQIELWGGAEKTITDKNEFNVLSFSESDFNMNLDGINSIRFYAIDPETESGIDDVLGVFYPQKSDIPDAMELIPRMQNWVDNTPQTMGNWVSKEAIREILLETRIKSVPVLRQELPAKELNISLQENKKLILIGFDILQIPRFKITYNFVQE